MGPSGVAVLPSVLTTGDLPLAELHAARLDGELFALAAGFCPVDEIEQARHRAMAVRAGRGARLIAELGTAAWVWGAADLVPPVLEFCVRLDARSRHAPTPLMAVREVVLDPDDIVDVGAPVTSPLRTAVDLARFRPVLHPVDADAIRRLADVGGFGRADAEALLDRRRNLPAKRRARERLRAVLG